jgi:LPPG:FO 2-phospho-L-lactate transferase
VRVTVIAGGVGSARFLTGLVRVIPAEDITVVVNTGDDAIMRGLHVSPDVDTVLYHLAGLTDWDRGWGIHDETFFANDRYGELASRVGGLDMQDWFALGDRDLATHMLRTQLLHSGMSLSGATNALRNALGVEAAILPASDDPSPTTLETDGGDVLDFQDYFVRLHQRPVVRRVRLGGGRPAPGVLDAVASASVVLVPPSNPLLSIAPVLALDGVEDALRETAAPRAAVSPIVGGRALRGPADLVMASLGHEVSAAGVAEIYTGLVDVFVLDARDEAFAPEIEALGMRPVVCDTIMRSPEDAARLAKIVLEEASR